MLSQILSLGLLASAAAAAAVSPRQTTPNYPVAARSKGFYLVANVTDPSTDFTPPVNNFYVNSIHVGAGLNLVGLTETPGRIFYQNGTAEEIQYRNSNVLTDGGTPPFPEGLTLSADDATSTTSTARLDGGAGQPGIALSRFPEGYKFLIPEQYAACNESIEYYQGQYFVIIKHFAEADSIPGNCAPVRLLPECTALNELPEGSYSSHEFAADSECYEDVSAIDWSLYGP